MFDIIKNIIDGRRYIFKSNEEKHKLMNQNNLSVEELSQIIKSLSLKDRKAVLKKIFNEEESNNLTEIERINLFTLLSYYDKVKVISNTPFDTCKQDLIKAMTKREMFKYLINNYTSDGTYKYMISLLTQNERKWLFYTPLILYPEYSAEIIKYFDEDYIEKFLKRRFGLNTRLTTSSRIELLTCLSNDMDKMASLTYPNKYNLQLDCYDRIKVILSLTDLKKIDFIRHDNYCGVELNNNDKSKLVMSLSDEYKMNYLKYPSKLNEFFCFSIDNFFSSFDEEHSKEILFKRNSYNYKFSNDNIITLINNLSIDERIKLLNEDNEYNIVFNIDRRCEVICNLPDEYKLRIISNAYQYNLVFEEEHIMIIIRSMRVHNIISLLVFNDKIINILSKKSIWRIIESFKREDVISILGTKNKQIKEFIEIYKTSFVKCLSNNEKIDVICNRSSLGINLDDSKRIKVLRSINPYFDASKYFSDNIFKYFDNIDESVDIIISNKAVFCGLHEVFQMQILSYMMNLDINDEEIFIGLDIIKYIPNGKDVLVRYRLLREAFKKLDINVQEFFQYGCNSNKYSWYTDILNILDNNELEDFCIVKNYFFNKYYGNMGKSRYNVRNFLELLNVYHKYKSFCLNLAFNNSKLSTEEKEDIRFLFNSDIVNNVNSLKEIRIIRHNKIKSYMDIANNNGSLYDLKNALIHLFFGKSLLEMEKVIQYTGGCEELKILQFNNRHNKQIGNIVDNLILVTSLIERIINTTDVEGLKKTLSYYCNDDNIEHTKRIVNYCSQYEEFNRKLYECDLVMSLSDICHINEELCHTEKAKELSQKYGGKVIDLSESQYVLAAHVKSYREKVEDLITGNCDGNSNFICMSPVSHRGQHYYSWYESSTVFAYDSIPTDSFICSSTGNLGSNTVLKYNSSEVPMFDRNQRDVLETSEAPTGHNSEILLYREGLKPCGLIVPSGTSPSEEAIKYHQEFNLPFIVTQPIDKRIDNPIMIEHNDKKEINVIGIDDKETLNDLCDSLEKFKNKQKRRIAILADPHALYEPTLACLVDIDKKGIDEIYSLGDNIGHGPSPKEVLDLLKEYGVKSIYGNHELYLIDDHGIDEFIEHFPSEESIGRTKDMLEWMREELPKETIEGIKKYPERYEFKMPNGKKVTLIHTENPYNCVGKYSKTPIIDKDSFVVKGHLHFAEKNMQGINLRAVGIGQNGNDDGMATYYVIDVLNNDYTIDRVDVPYDRSNLLHTINESSMPVRAKRLIFSWVKSN